MGTLVSLKPGVTVRGVGPEIAIAITIVASVYEQHGLDCIVTSVTDGVHGHASRHYSGAAADFRTRHISNPQMKQQIADLVREALGVGFDVVLEADHLHVEFDPKRVR